MTSEVRLEKVGWGFHDFLLASWVFFLALGRSWC
jgi:hypothetical protein